MTDLRLHGTEGAPLPSCLVRRREDGREPADFRGVPGLCRSSMRLDQLHSGRAVVGLLISAEQRLRLSLWTWRVDACALSVRGPSESANDRVDGIAVGFGIKTPEQAAAVAAVADAAVVGSALVDTVADNLDEAGRPRPGLAAAVLSLVGDLARGVRGARMKGAAQ